MMMDYLKNINLAISLGFEEKLDPNAYKGKLYTKNGLIWIHDIDALKNKLVKDKIIEDKTIEDKLGIDSYEDLRKLNYDVDTYFKYVDYTNKMVDIEIARIKFSISSGDSVLFARHDILYDSEIISGMARLSEEGFDDEILADYAHQMSKR